MQTLPENSEYEKLVLGSVLLNADLMHAARPVLAPEDFSIDKHRKIWARSCELYDAGSAVEVVTVWNELRKHAGEAESCDGLAGINALTDGVPMLPSVGSYVQGIKDKATLRSVVIACQNMITRACSGQETAQQILESASQTIMGLTPQAANAGLQSAKDLVDEVGLARLLTSRKEKGLMFPWPWMNHVTGGMLPAELWILAGHTSTGKTSAMLQHAVTAARRGQGVAIFSLEVGKESLFQKACYQISRVDSEKAKRGLLDSEEKRLVNQAAAELYDMPLYFDTQSTTTMAIHAAIRRQKLKAPIHHVIVDYLQLLGNTGKHDNRAQAVGANAWALKMIATDFQIPVLLLSQFSRASNKPGQKREPELTDLKETGDIENHANGVWFLHRENDADSNQIAIKFLLPKQRDGRRNIYQDFFFYPQYQRFEQVSDGDYE